MQETPCARFLNSDRKYNKTQNRPTYKAFEPTFDPDENAIVLSMYRLDELATAQIVELGQSVLGPNGGRLHGHAEIKGGEIESLPKRSPRRTSSRLASTGILNDTSPLPPGAPTKPFKNSTRWTSRRSLGWNYCNNHPVALNDVAPFSDG